MLASAGPVGNMLLEKTSKMKFSKTVKGIWTELVWN